MPRHVLTLNDLGEEGSWLLVQQARGIPDAKSRTDFMTERTAVLLFAQDSFAERLCVSAAVRQMGGSLVFQGATGGWKSEVERYQRQMLAVIDYFVDCMYVYGIPGLATSVDRDLVQFPIINAGSPDAHPAHVLADVACMLRYTRDDLKKARVGWLGCTNGTLFSLIEALRYFPFSLQVALPPLEDRPTLETYARHCGVKVDFVDTPQQAVEGCNFVYAGCRSGLDDELAQQWKVDDALLSHADQKARVLHAGHRGRQRHPCQPGIAAAVAVGKPPARAQAPAALGLFGKRTGHLAPDHPSDVHDGCPVLPGSHLSFLGLFPLPGRELVPWGFQRKGISRRCRMMGRGASFSGMARATA